MKEKLLPRELAFAENYDEMNIYIGQMFARKSYKNEKQRLFLYPLNNPPNLWNTQLVR
jgi:hypothetical protein